jgi:hypothetical protein
MIVTGAVDLSIYNIPFEDFFFTFPWFFYLSAIISAYLDGTDSSSLFRYKLSLNADKLIYDAVISFEVSPSS